MKKLYHFTKSKSAINILGEGKLKTSQILGCNDPFDMDLENACIILKNDSEKTGFYNDFQKISNREVSMPDRKDVYYLREFSEFTEKNKKNIYISCFSDCNNISESTVMMSHYGDNHRGVILEFGFPENQVDLQVFRVDYGNINPCNFSPSDAIDFLRISKKNKKNFDDYDKEIEKKFYRKIFLTKHSDWSYEKEFRIISIGKNINFIKINYDENVPNTLTGIYFLLKTDRKKIDKIVDIVNKKYPNTKIWFPEKDKEEIKVNFKEMK